MKRIFTIISILFICTMNGVAQVYILGQVKNEKQEPLEMANVIAMYENGKDFATYGTSDVNGKYRLEVKANTKYLLKVSYVGMKTAEIWVQTIQQSVVKNITMALDNTLDEVNVVYKMPVRVMGDTIVYNADSFTTGTEKKLGDVLKTLPGVEVDENGDVKVEGKKVNKVMVEGKPFFEGNTKLATKNIPANAVDKVQVLRNHSDIGQMSSVRDNSENVALNIKLKEGKTNFWFGDITSGIDYNKKYLLHPNLFYYSPKYSANIIADMNNIGEQAFTFMDYFKFSGGFKNLNNGSSFELSPDLTFLLNKNNKVKQMNTRFGAGNFNYSPNKKINIGGFIIYSGTENKVQELSEKHYLQAKEEQATKERIDNKSEQENNLALAKISLEYKPNTNHQANYEAMGQLIKANKNYQTQSSVLQYVKQNRDNESYSLKQNLEYYYTLSEKHIFALEVQHHIQKNNPFYNAVLKQFAFSDFIGLDALQSQINVNQKEMLKSNKLDAKLDYFYLLNKKSNLNITLGTSYNQQKFNSSIFQLLDNGNKEISNNTNMINDVKYTVNDNYAGLHYRFLAGKFTFNQGVILHRYSTKDTWLKNSKTSSFYRLLPDLSIKLSLRQTESFYLNYAMENNFTDIKKRAEAYVLNNYNYLFRGNRNLQHSTQHRISLSYFNFDAFNFTNTNIRLSYIRKADVIRNHNCLDGINTISSSDNSPFPDENWQISANFEKRFSSIKWQIDAEASYAKNIQSLMVGTSNYQDIDNVLIGQNYHTAINSNFKNAPNFDLGYRININHYKQGTSNERYITHSPYAKLNIYLWKRLLLQAKYTYNNYSNRKQLINTYDFLGISISCQKPDSHWEFVLSGDNLLNTKSLNSSYANTYLISNSQYFIQGRVMMFKVVYSL